jgi:hypothetical protein
VHFALNGQPPDINDASDRIGITNLNPYRWRSYCRGLFQLPVAA